MEKYAKMAVYSGGLRPEWVSIARAATAGWGSIGRILFYVFHL